MSSNIPCNTDLLVRKRKKKQNKKQQQQQQKTKYEENTLKKYFFVKVFVNQLDFAPENELLQYSANWRPSKV